MEEDIKVLLVKFTEDTKTRKPINNEDNNLIMKITNTN